MNKKFQDAIKKLKEIEKKVEELKKIKEPTYQQYKELETWDRVFETYLNEFYTKILKSYNTFEDMLGAIDNIGGKEEYNKGYPRTIFVMLDMSEPGFKEVQEIVNNTKISISERHAQAMDFLSNNEDMRNRYQEGVFRKGVAIFKNKLDIKNAEELEQYINSIPEDKQEEIVPDKIYLEDSITLSTSKDVSVVDKEINELIEQNQSDVKYIEILNQAKELTKEGSVESTEVNRIFENVASYSVELSRKQNIKNINNEKIVEVDPESDFVLTGVYYKPDTDKKIIIEDIKKIKDKEFSFDEDFLKDVDEIFKGIKELDTGNYFSKEQTFKNNVIQAIKSKDKKEITKAVNEHNKVREEYDKVFNQIDAIKKTDFIPGNISVGRVSNISAKYRNNFETCSIYDALFAYSSELRKMNIDIKDYLKHPLDTWREILANQRENGILTANFRSKPIDKALETFLKADFQQSIQTNEIGGTAFHKKISALNDVLANFMPKEQREQFGAYNNMFFGQMVAAMFEPKGYSATYLERDLPNLLVLEDRDRDLIKAINPGSINPSTLKIEDGVNPLEYINTGKTNVNRVVARLASVAANPKTARDPYIKAGLTKTAKMLLEANLNMDSQTRDLLGNVSKKRFDKLSKEYLNSYKKQVELKEAIHNHTEHDPNTVMQDIANLEKDYKSRGIISRIFNRDSRALSNNISSMKKMLQNEMGMSKKDFNKAYDLILNGDNNRANARQADNVVRISVPSANLDINNDIRIDNQIDNSKAKENEIENERAA